MIGKGSACGKIIFIGEHFLVQEPHLGGIAFPLTDLNCNIKIQFSEKPQYNFSYEGKEKIPFDQETIKNYFSRAIRIACDSMRLSQGNQSFRVDSKINFPLSRGFGSSGAFAVSLSRALLDIRTQISKNWELSSPDQEILDTAFNVEKLFHDTPSGIDSNVIFLKKPIYFVKSNNKPVITEVSNKCVDIIVADSGERELTSTLIKNISTFKLNQPTKWMSYVKRMEQAIQTSLTAFQSTNALGLMKDSVREANQILTELSLSTPRILEMIDLACNHGALAGKVSGAGGGGATIFITKPGESNAIASKLIDLRFSIQSIVKATP